MTWRTDIENAPRVAGSPNLQRLFDTRRELREVEAVKCGSAEASESRRERGTGLPRAVGFNPPSALERAGVATSRPIHSSQPKDTE